MGKPDKERLEEAPKSTVTPELLAHMYDKNPPTRDVFVRTTTGQIVSATITNSSPLEIRRAIDGNATLPPSNDVFKLNPQRKSEKPSQRDRKPKYNNNSSRRKGR